MRFRFPTAFLAALLVAGGAQPAGAQDSTGRAGLDIEAGIRATSFRSEFSWMGGGSALVRPWHGLALGGGGWMLMGSRRIDPDSPGGGLRLRVAYGGLVAATPLPGPGRTEADLRVLLGAGNARIELSAPRAEIAADNFLVVEPEVGITMIVAWPLTARVSLAYRFVGGVEDVSGVTARQLRGLSATAFMGFRTR